MTDKYADIVETAEFQMRAGTGRVDLMEGKTHDPYHFVEVDGEKFWSERLVNLLEARLSAPTRGEVEKQITQLRMSQSECDFDTDCFGWSRDFANAADLIERLYRESEARGDALERFREHVRILQGRIEFANLPIGNCGYCMVGNKPGDHHLPDCPAYRATIEKLEEK